MELQEIPYSWMFRARIHARIEEIETPASSAACLTERKTPHIGWLRRSGAGLIGGGAEPASGAEAPIEAA